MKINRISIFLAAVLVFSTACNPYKIEIPHWPYEDPDWVDDGSGNTGTWDPESAGSQVVYPTAGGEKVKTLLTTSGWSTSVIDEGLTFYHFMGKSEDANNDNQDVYVLELDLDNPNYRLYFHFGGNTTSGAASNLNAVAAINATYERPAVYIRVQGTNKEEVTLEPGHLRFWKHGGAIVGDGRKIAIVNGRVDRPSQMNVFRLTGASIPEDGELKVIDPTTTVNGAVGVVYLTVPANGFLVVSDKPV